MDFEAQAQDFDGRLLNFWIIGIAEDFAQDLEFDHGADDGWCVVLESERYWVAFAGSREGCVSAETPGVLGELIEGDDLDTLNFDGVGLDGRFVRDECGGGANS